MVGRALAFESHDSGNLDPIRICRVEECLIREFVVVAMGCVGLRCGKAEMG